MGKNNHSFLVNLGNSCTDIKFEDQGRRTVLSLTANVKMKNLSGDIFPCYLMCKVIKGI
jgi:hypothetical protein